MTDGFEDEIDIPDDIVGPFLSERRVPRGFRHEGVQTASVIFYTGGGCTVVTTEGALVIEPHRVLARRSTVCEIVRGRHVTAFEAVLPAAGAATFFRAKVALRWEVTDFRQVALKRLRSVEEDLRPEVLALLQRVSERYAVDQAQWVNQAIRTQIENGEWAKLGRDVGLAVQMFVDVGTDRIHIDSVSSRRKDEIELRKFRDRLPVFDDVAGDSQKQIAAWLASTDQKDIHAALGVLRQEAADDRRENQAMALRMMNDGRIASPEVEAYLRSQVMRQAAPWAPPPQPHEWALPAPPTVPPRPELPPAPPRPWPEDDEFDSADDTWRDSHTSQDDAGDEPEEAYEGRLTQPAWTPRPSRSDDEHWAVTADDDEDPL